MNDPQRPPPAPQPWGYIAYEPPAAQRGFPSAITWYRVYAVTSGLVYATAFANGLREAHPHSGANFWGVLAFAAVVVSVFVAGAFVPRSPRGWTLGLVVIALGLLGCFFPISIALLVQWGKPQTKAAFRRV